MDEAEDAPSSDPERESSGTRESALEEEEEEVDGVDCISALIIDATAGAGLESVGCDEVSGIDGAMSCVFVLWRCCGRAVADGNLSSELDAGVGRVGRDEWISFDNDGGAKGAKELEKEEGEDWKWNQDKQLPLKELLKQ